VVQGKLYQVVVAYVGIIEIVKALAQPACQLRKFLQMSCVASARAFAKSSSK
jgi:hypothetical protein